MSMARLGKLAIIGTIVFWSIGNMIVRGEAHTGRQLLR